LERIPLNAHGKIDREALPKPTLQRNDERVFVEPRTPAEKELAKIWSEVLRISRIGIEDSFFYLGGNSLSFTQVVSRIRKSFKVEVPVGVLFDAPTIRQMAQAVLAEQIRSTDKEKLSKLLARLKQVSGANAGR
jgi:acyl carrier protein